MSLRTPILILLLFCVSTPLNTLAADAGPLRVGASAVDVSPRQFPVSLRSGKALDTSAVHDPLHARTIVFDDGKTSLAIVVLDALGAPPEIRDTKELLNNQLSKE